MKTLCMLALRFWVILIAGLTYVSPSLAEPVREKPRIVVLTDIENEPDDAESMVRFLTYANQFDVEGLVATTSVHMRDRVAPERIREIVKAYGAVRTNLLLHEPDFPTAEALLSVVHEGVPGYGLEALKNRPLTKGAELLIKVVDKKDHRPVWVLAWGGTNTLAQAVMHVRKTRTSAKLKAFIKKLRVYTISDQDDAGPWLRKNYADLFYIVSPGMHAGGAYHAATWSGISGDRFHGRFVGADFSIVDTAWLKANIISKGALGAVYPEPKFLMEGDTPSFLYLIDNGLGSPENPNWGSWGGRYEFYQPRTQKWFLMPETRPFWADAEDEVLGIDKSWHTSNKATIWRWREAYQNDFAARMDWTIKPYDQANHPPRIVLGHADRLTARLGDKVTLNAADSMDPDGHDLSYEWFVYNEAGGFSTSTAKTAVAIPIDNANQAQASLTIHNKRIMHLGDIHVILAVTDNGSPRLTRYRRVIITVKE